MRTVRTFVGAFLAVLAVGPGSATAQTAGAPTGDALDELTARVASQLRCPVCRQLSINDSQSDLALEAKSLIRDRLAAGESPAEVKAYFVSKYGEWVLLAPPKRGFTLLVWILPVGVFAAGGVLLATVLRRWLPPAPETAVDREAGNEVP